MTEGDSGQKLYRRTDHVAQPFGGYLRKEYGCHDADRNSNQNCQKGSYDGGQYDKQYTEAGGCGCGLPHGPKQNFQQPHFKQRRRTADKHNTV